MSAPMSPQLLAELRETTIVPFPGGRSPEYFVRTAARNAISGYAIGGSNVTAMVLRTLRLLAEYDTHGRAAQLRATADRIERQKHLRRDDRLRIHHALMDAAEMLQGTDPVEGIQDAIERVWRAGAAPDRDAAAGLVQASVECISDRTVLTRGVDDCIAAAAPGATSAPVD